MSGQVGQRVVVIQDASRDVCWSAIGWVIQGYSLKPGDLLVLFGVLHQVNSPMGYKFKVDPNSMFGVNPKFIEEEVTRKTEEYLNDAELTQISQKCEAEQIEFRVEVRAGGDPKVVGLTGARSFKATWVILDRHMKKDKKYFMDKLPCGVSKIKHDNRVEKLRGPKPRRKETTTTERNTGSKDQVSYNEMIPGSPKNTSFSHKPPVHPNSKVTDHHEKDTNNQNHGKSTSSSKSSPSEALTLTTASTPSYGASRETFTITSASTSTSSHGYYEASSSTFPEAKFYYQDGENGINTKRERAEQVSSGSPSERQNQYQNYNDWIRGSSKDEVFRNSICSSCNNKRPNIGWQRDFSYAELHAATDGFHMKNFLSEGGFGSVFKGEFNGLKIAVKQHKNASFQGEKEFKSEVQVLSKARHENLVMLLGSCSEGTHRLLVYEFVCNGSLDQHLSKHTRKPLSWEQRMKIASGAAKGLQYLHENNIIHRDMRPNNILITHDHEALLGDFGLARTQHEDSDHSSETRLVGTLGYLAPEYAECGKISTKTDVYSFGVVLLQLITGLKTTEKMLGGKSLVGWARPLLKEKNYPDLIDERILECHDVHQLFWMVRVAEKCLSKDPQKRLTMDKVVYALNTIMESNPSCSIREISPAQSDSVSSARDSYDTPDDDTTFSIDTTSVSKRFSIETTSISSMSHISGMLPPSPPIGFPPLLQD